MRYSSILMKKRFQIVAIIMILIFLVLRGFYSFYFLRSPVRNVPNDDTLFVSPANGKIISIIPFDGDLSETELYKKHNVVLDDWTEGFSS